MTTNIYTPTVDRFPTKRPSDIRVYGIDWTDWLPAGRSIVGGFSSVPIGTVQALQTSLSEDSTTTLVKYGGGTFGEECTVIVGCNLDDGQIYSIPVRLGIANAPS